MTSPVLRAVQGLRYVLALREGGSLPGLVEADDLGTYVVKSRGAGDAVGGEVARRPLGERFRWLIAPRSTVVQTSPVHTGMTDDPAAELADLVARMVEPPR